MLNLKTATLDDVKNAETSELVETFNKIMGKTIKKFENRTSAVSRTWKAIQSLPPGEETAVGTKAKTEKTSVKEVKKKRTMRFCFAPVKIKDLKPIKETTLRFKVYQMLDKASGVLFSEIQKAFGWDARNTYEAIRLIHFRTGQGMWSETQANGDIRIRLIKDDKEYATLCKSLKNAA